jgi:tetratricopeptide (TPR) repeat protein
MTKDLRNRTLALGACLLGIALLLPGCRLFRHRGPSDEDIAAARQLSRQGLDAQQRSDWQRAELLFAAAIVKSPNDERAHFGYAESRWRRGDKAAAISSMEEAVRLSGYDPERRVRLGNMYLASGDIERAALQAERAIATNPQLAGAWALRGKTEQAVGAFDEALASYHRALSLDAALADVQIAVADVYAEQDRPQRALATLQSLVDHYPVNQAPPEVLFREGLALRALGRPREAIALLAKAAERSLQRGDVLLELARTQEAAGDVAAARLTLADALRREPRHSGCLAYGEQLQIVSNPVMTVAAQDGERR